jgi:hypothetical protein
VSLRVVHAAAIFLGVCAIATIAPPVSAFTWDSSEARLKGWQADFDTVLVSFLPHDRSFDPPTRARFIKTIHALKDSVNEMTDAQLTVRLAAAVATAHNAHTRLYLLRNRTVLRRYPIRLWWFGKDLVIVRAKPEQAGLLGGKITALGGKPVAELAAAVAPLYAANPSWARYMSSYLLTSPEILQGLGLTMSNEIAITAELPGQRMMATQITPMDLERSDQPVEAWWDLSPFGPSPQGPWLSAILPDSTSLPLYLRHFDRSYWWEEMPAAHLLYVQYNRAEDQAGHETVRAFGDSLLLRLEHDPPKKLVLDLRFNTGGNLELSDSLLRRIAALPLAQEPGHLFVITGRATFSAGITAVALLRQLARVTIVGEPAGDGLDFWAEGGNVTLHHTGLTLHYANGFHSYSTVEYPDRKPYYYDLSVKDIGPDIPVETSVTEYLAGKDPVLEAIVKQP